MSRFKVLIVVTFVGGATISGIASHLITKKIITEKLNKELSMELKEIREDMEKERNYVNVSELDAVPYERTELEEIRDVIIDLMLTDAPREELEEAINLSMEIMDRLREDKNSSLKDPVPEDYEQRVDYSKYAKRDDRILLNDDGKPDLEDLMARAAEAPIEFDDVVDQAIAERQEEYEENHANMTGGSAKPYVLNVEEYESAWKNDKVDMTWWEGSETLTDIDEDIIPDIDGTIGYHNLKRFGDSGDGDKDTVYIRNDRLGWDICLIKDERNFAQDL